MTVTELIEELKKLPQNGDVYYIDIQQDPFYGRNIRSVDKIEVDKDGDIVLS